MSFVQIAPMVYDQNDERDFPLLNISNAQFNLRTFAFPLPQQISTFTCEHWRKLPIFVNKVENLKGILWYFLYKSGFRLEMMKQTLFIYWLNLSQVSHCTVNLFQNVVKESSKIAKRNFPASLFTKFTSFLLNNRFRFNSVSRNTFRQSFLMFCIHFQTQHFPLTSCFFLWKQKYKYKAQKVLSFAFTLNTFLNNLRKNWLNVFISYKTNVVICSRENPIFCLLISWHL